jgi:PAS domain S-box-containing protein
MSTSLPTGAAREDARANARQQLLEGENEVLKLIIDRAPLTSILEAIVRVAERQSSGGLLASILLLDETGTHLRHGAAPSLPADYSRAIDGLAIGPGVGSCGTAAYRGEMVVVSDIATDPLWKDFQSLAAQHGLRACWSAPILSARRAVLGTFALYYNRPCSPGADDEAIIQILTRTAALAIEHCRAENELAESEERFRSLTRCAPLGVFMIDADGAFNYVNPRFIEIGAFEYEKTFEYWLESAAGRMPQGWPEAVRARAEYSADLVVKREGGERPASLRMAPLRSRTGAYLGYVGTLEDLSERVAGEAALRRETSLRRAIEESVPSGIAVIAPDGTQAYVNRAFADMVGWPAADLIGAKPPFVYWPDEDVPAIQRALDTVRAGATAADAFELRFRRRNGSLFDVLVTLAPLHDDGGDVSGWVASVSDITGRKREREQLSRSEARLAMALEAGRMGAWEWDIRSGAVSWSPQLEALEHFQADMNPEHRPRVHASIEQALRTRSDYRVEYEIIRPDGSRTWVQARGRVLCDTAGEPEKMVGVCMETLEPS